MQHAAIPLQSFTQEIHRGPVDDAKATTIEQMNDQRTEDRCRAGCDKGRADQWAEKRRKQTDTTRGERGEERELE